MIKLRTEIDLSDVKLQLSYTSKILFVGSCFTNNIGKQFKDNCFDVLVNPFGTLYNPISIANNLQALIEKRILALDDLFYDKEQYHSFNFHSSFSQIEASDAVSIMNKAIEQGHHFLKNASYLFVTFGTSYVFQTVQQETVVANCHKLPASTFHHRLADIAEMKQIWTKLLNQLSIFNPNLQIIVTVSPIRHLSDGLHQNQVSKAQLILLADYMCQSFSNLTYFPSYEILLDDLRDYRFYDIDMVHPNTLATKYIWDLLADNCLDHDTQQLLMKVQKIQKAINHKPFNNQSPAYKHFLDNSLHELNLLSQEYPYLRIEEIKTSLLYRLAEIQ